jgi:ATP-dependent DNA helicase PIF1
MCIKASPLWAKLSANFSLTTNLRLDPNAGNVYPEYLRSVGKGTHLLAAPIDPSTPDALPIRLPGSMVLQLPRPTIVDLVAAVYEPLAETGVTSEEYFAKRCILAPYVVDVAAINDLMLGSNEPPIVEYRFADSIEKDHEGGGTDLMPPEILHMQNQSNFPPHRLRVRVGVQVILLRSVDPANGLCNGTRLIIEQCGQWVLQARILCGAHKGNVVLLPRMDLTTGEGERLPFIMRRRQFPVALAFSMTINKSQGQSLSNVGIYLSRPVFAHGQLYVALSRARDPAKVHVLSVQDRFKSLNVVYQNVLTM